jgi:hypothetical protein
VVPSGSRLLQHDPDATQLCVVCQEDIGHRRRMLVTRCGHMFHARCILGWCESQRGVRQVTCPSCRVPVDFDPRVRARQSPATSSGSDDPSSPPADQPARPAETHPPPPMALAARLGEAVVATSPALVETCQAPAAVASQVPGASPQQLLCTCPGRSGRAPRQGRHYATCPRSASYAPPVPSDAPSPTSPAAHANSTAPALVPPFPLHETPPFSYEQVARLSNDLPSLEAVPRGAVAQVAVAFSAVLRACTSSVPQHRRNALRVLYAFSLLVLGRPPQHGLRGGVSLSTVVATRARLLLRQGGPQELWEEAQTNARARVRYYRERNPPASDPPPLAPLPDRVLAPTATLALLGDRVDPVPPSDRALQRAHNLATKGQYSRAARALVAAEVVPVTPSSLEQMRAKHPSAPLPVYGEVPRCTVEVSEADVRRVVHSFPAGTAAGPSGWSSDLLVSLVSHPASTVAADLRPIFQSVMDGSLDDEAREAFFSARLVALLKQDQSLRPLGIGESVLRRAPAKILLRRIREVARRRRAAAHA